VDKNNSMPQYVTHAELKKALKDERETYLMPAFEELKLSIKGLNLHMLQGFQSVNNRMDAKFHIMGLKMDQMNTRIDQSLKTISKNPKQE
jgi:hypothetical protein